VETERKMQLAYSMKLSGIRFGIKLVQFDAKMNQTKEVLFQGGNKDFGPIPASLKMVDGSLFLVYTQYEENERLMRYFAAPVDPASLQVGAAKEIFKIEQENYGLSKATMLVEEQVLTIKPDPDHSRLLFFWASTLTNQYYATVLDNKFNVLWSKKETVAVADRLRKPSATIDNEGTIYVSYKYKIGKDEYACNMAMLKKEGTTKTREIKVQEGSPFQVQLVSTPDGRSVELLGTIEQLPERLVGVYRQTYTIQDQKFGPMQETRFSDELLEGLDKYEWASTKARKFGTIPITMQALAFDDGGLSLVGEFRKYDQGEKGMFTHSGSILAVRFSGAKAVVSAIPKYRVSTTYTIGDSYKAFPYKNDLLLFYNDHEKNLDVDLSGRCDRSDNYSKSVLVAAFIGADGKISRRVVADMTSDDFLPVGDQAIMAGNEGYIFPTYKIKSLGRVGDEAKMVEVKLKQ
jgi:hypothetical protein